MKISWEGFLARNMSWSFVGQNLSRSFIALGHQVDLFSTNGIEKFPEDLKSNLIGYGEGMKISSGKRPDKSYDLSLSYTAMKNFPYYLSHTTDDKNRFGIWAYEFDGKNALPLGFAKNHHYCDLLLAPSTFAKQVFINSGVPENKIKVIPHGVSLEEINNSIPIKLNTSKTNKILVNLGQLHKRKNIEGTLETYGKAFNKNNDVCLILKIQDKKPSQQFEISFDDIYYKFIKKYPNHAEVEIINYFIPNIYSLYKSCDIILSTSFCEGFGMTHLEGMACGLVPLAPNYGGFLDFIKDEKNLINGSIFNVSPDFLYYQNKSGTIAFKPDTDDGAQKLINIVNNLNEYKNKLEIQKIKDDFSWLELGKKILQLIN